LKHKPWMGWANTPIRRRIRDALITLALVIPAAWRIKRWQCDIIYTNTITIWIGAVVARILRKPHVWHFHEFGGADHGMDYLYGEAVSLKLLKSLSSRYIANSEAVAKKFTENIIPGKLAVIYQSVTLMPGGPEVQPSERFRCVIVGKVSPGKGQEDAIRAVAALVAEDLAVELYIIGDGEGYAQFGAHLAGLIKEAGIGKYVHFKGYCEAAFEYMRSANVVLMCSRCEAFGRVTVEGMLAGKAVIGTRSGATIELIREGGNGLLYAPGDHRELAEKIRYLYHHPEAARTMGENGRRWATAHFSQERYGAELLGLLASLLKNRAGGSRRDLEK